MTYTNENPITTEESLKTSSTAQTLSGRVVSALILVSLVAGFLGGYAGSQRRVQPLAEQHASTQSVTISENSAVVNVVKKASPAVVSIVISKDLSKIPGYGRNSFGFDPFDQLFGFNRTTPQTPQEPNVQKVGAGSGFFVSSNGLILTNKHVVSDTAASYTVLTSDGKSYEAKVVGSDPVNDIALVKIDIVNAPTLALASSDNLDIGQTVIAIGNSLGQYSNTVTVGVVSGIGRSITAGGNDGAEQLEGVIQTDAAINPGNSGGPLLNIAGQVIGINTAIDQEGQSVGFAIPSNDVQKDLDSFNKTGKITRPLLGVRYLMITPDIAKQQKLPKEYGALVSRGQQISDVAVVPGSPADKAGIVENDIILEVNGQKLDEQHTLAGALRKFSTGDVLTLKLYRKGEEKTVQVTLEEAK